MIKGNQILDLPVDKSSLGVHQIKLVIKSCPSFSNGGRVGEHADSSLDFGEITTGHDSWRLVVDAYFETSWAPVDKLNGSLCLDIRDRRVYVLWNNITSEEQAAGHVLAMSRITLDHLIRRLEAGVRDFRDRKLLVVSFFGGNDRSVSGQGEVDPRVGHQVCLELGQIDVKSAVESERSGDRGDDLADETV